jgi:hypothetical protein
VTKSLKDYPPGSIVAVDGVLVEVLDADKLAERVFANMLAALGLDDSGAEDEDDGDEVCGIDCGCAGEECQFDADNGVDYDDLDPDDQMKVDVAIFMQDLNRYGAVLRSRDRSAATGELVEETPGDYTVTAYKYSESMGPMVFVSCCGWKTFDQIHSDFYVIDDEGNEVSVYAQ